MTNLVDSDRLSNINELSLNRLARAINLSQGQFSLILAECNSESIQAQVVETLPDLIDVQILYLNLETSITNLFTTIKTAIYPQQPSALMIFGLESVIALEKVLTNANWMRDQFRRYFRFPIILWINAEISDLFKEIIPDLRNWIPAPIQFADNFSSLANLQPLTQRNLAQTHQDTIGTLASIAQSEQPIISSFLSRETRDYSYQFRERLSKDYGIPEVMIIEPDTFIEILPLIQVIRTRKSLLINLRQMHLAEAQRAVDFLTGATYALDGDQCRIGESVFIFTSNCIVLRKMD